MKLTVLVLSLFISSFAIGQTQKILESSVRFEIKNAGITVEGKLSGLKGSISFDPEKYASAKVAVQVPVSSIKTGIALRDKHLKQKEYFDESTFPEIAMSSKFFGKGTKEGEFRAYLTLTLKGKTGDITLPFTCTKELNGYRIKGQFTINRLDYGVGEKSAIMGNEVIVFIDLLLSDSSKSEKPMRNTPKSIHALPFINVYRQTNLLHHEKV